jgi:arylformamidase
LDSIDGVQPGEIVILHTGIWQKFGKKEFTSEMPQIPRACVESFVSKGIHAFGTDCISVDPLNSPKQVNHKLLLGAGIPIIEGLWNLDALTENPAFLVALPLKLSDREAAPARVIAIEGRNEL